MITDNDLITVKFQLKEDLIDTIQIFLDSNFKTYQEDIDLIKEELSSIRNDLMEIQDFVIKLSKYVKGLERG